MAADGTIGRLGSNVARQIEWGAWAQLFSHLRGANVLPDGDRLLRIIDPGVRAQIFNDRLARVNPHKEVKIGVRRDGTGGAWSIFRTVGAKFPENGTGADACDAAAEALEGLNFRGHVEYDPNTTDVRFDAAHMASPTVLDPTVGDIFRGGIKGKTNDAGGGAFVVQPFVGRIICINCTIADAYAPGVRKAHRGDMAAAIQGIRDAAELAAEVVPLFAADWSVLRDTPISAVDWEANLGRLSLDTRATLSSDPTAANVIRALVESKKLDAKIGRDTLVQVMLSSFADEPGETLADIINAVTRAAHERVPVLVGAKLEQDAGALVPWMAHL